MRGVHAGIRRVGPPGFILQRSNAFALVRREHRELDAVHGQRFERSRVCRRLWQPHALRRRAEAALIVRNAPANLRVSVARVGERQNHVVVALRHGRAMAVVTLAATAFAVENHAVRSRSIFLEPTQQRRAEVEAHARVVVHDARDLVFCVDDARGAVGRVALGADALVPVVVGSGRVLSLDRLKPGILAWRLVKMAVNANEALSSRHGHQIYCGAQSAWRLLKPFYGQSARAIGTSALWAQSSWPGRTRAKGTSSR